MPNSAQVHHQMASTAPSSTSTAVNTTSAAAPPRQKPSRSLTTQPAGNPPASNQQPTSSQQPQRPRRTQSEDSSSQDVRVARAANSRTKSHGATGAGARPTKEKPSVNAEKPSVHADHIDILDNSGLGPATGMFHHDGPFDACAPSRNKSHRAHRAPMLAFNDDGLGGGAGVPVYDKRLSPLAQATIAAMNQSDTNTGPYPTRAFQGPPPTNGRGGAPGTTMMGGKLGPSPRKMTLNEAWGMNEPEPFEEFSAGRGSARSSLEHPPEGGFEAMYKRDARAAAARRGESLDITPRRNKIPPPQPIFLPGTRAQETINTNAAANGTMPHVTIDAGTPTSPSADTSGQRTPMVQRTRSLMQRIRRMRDNPNVPVGQPADGYFSDTHAISGSRHQNSSPWVTVTPGPRATIDPPETISEASPLGTPTPAGYVPSTRPVVQQRSQTQVPITNVPRQQQHRRGSSKEQIPPSAYPQRAPPPPPPPGARSPTSPDEPFVMVERDQNVGRLREKALPMPPGTQSLDDVGYYNRVAPGPGIQGVEGGGRGGAGVGRKVSLYKKMKDAVVGPK